MSDFRAMGVQTRNVRPRRQLLWALLAGCALGWPAIEARAEQNEPLYLEDPYDIVTLNEFNNKLVMKVFPLKLANRKVPKKPPPAEELEIRMIDRPDRTYTVEWDNVASVQLFEDRVLAEAEQVVEQKKYDEAFGYFRFLEGKYPKTAGLKAAVESYLWAQITDLYKAKRYDESMALLVELHGRNAERKGLAEAFERVSNKLIQRQIEAGNFRAARVLLRGLVAKFPDTQETSGAKWEAQLKKQAQAALVEAQRHFDAGRLRDAQWACRRVIDIWPTLAGGKELAETVQAKYPLVVVGVTSPWNGSARDELDDWAARRGGRLLDRMLFEYAGAGEQGGRYISPFGEARRPTKKGPLILQLRPDIHWPQTGRAIASQDVVQALLALADPQRPAADSEWSSAFGEIIVPGALEVQVELRNPQPCAEGRLASALSDESVVAGTSGSALRMGPYALDAPTAKETHYVAQEGYFAAGPSQPKEIVERAYSDAALAMQALRRGDVSVVDRLNPWEVEKLRSSKTVTVEPYALPTVHVLVPNLRKPLLANRAFRRALAYGIDRSGILERALLAGKATAGSQIISGPFPQGLGGGDPHGYAYDEKVEDHPYDPAVAMLLVAEAAPEEVQAAKAPGSAAKGPALVLVHPPQAVARLACQSIARQWQALGLRVSLKEQPAGEPLGNDFDVAYVELAMTEPALEAARLLGPQGMSGGCSPYMYLALHQLEQAGDWPRMCSRLKNIHRLAHDEVAVIPLWQIVEHLAYHASTKGIGAKPVLLYQNVEQWQSDLRIPTE